MKKIATLRDDELFKDDIDEHTTYDNIRRSSKVIVFDDENNIALVGTTYLVIPGGKIEDNETPEECAVRECKEEIDCDIELTREIGMVEDYRPWSNMIGQAHGFSARLIGAKGTNKSPIEHEKDDRVEWHPIDKALENINKSIEILDHTKHKHSYYNLRECKVILEEYIKINK